MENPTILGATHAALVAPTLAALAQSQFEPARQGPVARRGSVRQVVEFSSALDDRAAILEADGITAAGGAPLSTLEGGLPLPQCMIEPIYPRELLLAGEAGEAVIEIIVDRDGRVRLPKIISATHPEYGMAAATAAAQGVFIPPTRHGQPTDVRVRVPFSL
jgi:TonB family protein